MKWMPASLRLPHRLLVGLAGDEAAGAGLGRRRGVLAAAPLITATRSIASGPSRNTSGAGVIWSRTRSTSSPIVSGCSGSAMKPSVMRAVVVRTARARCRPSRSQMMALLPTARMRVQAQVVGEQRDVVIEQRPQPRLLAVAERRPRPRSVEQAVVDDHHLGAVGGRPLEQLQRRADAGGHVRHLLGAGHLHADRHPVRVAVDVEQLVQEGDDGDRGRPRPARIPAAARFAATAGVGSRSPSTTRRSRWWHSTASAASTWRRPRRTSWPALVRDHLVAAHPDMPVEEDDLEALLDEYAYDPVGAGAGEE